MKKPNLFIKVLTLTGFVLLISGFVAYRGGAFDHLTQTSQADELDEFEMMGSTKSAAVFDEETWAMDTDTPPEKEEITREDLDIIMHSSKSAPVFDESFFESLDSDSVIIPPADNETEQQTIMGGSKSDIIFPPEEDQNANKPPRPQPNSNRNQPRIMPSSKSGGIFEPKKEKPEPQKQQK